jgi:hypothetical protein
MKSTGPAGLQRQIAAPHRLSEDQDHLLGPCLPGLWRVPDFLHVVANSASLVAVSDDFLHAAANSANVIAQPT